MTEIKKGEDGVFDFDALVIEPRVCRVGGEEVDVSVIPVAVQLQLARYSERSKAEIIEAATRDGEGEMDRMFAMIAQVTTLSNPKVTAEFLAEHLDYEKFSIFAQFVLRPARVAAEKAQEDETEGNEETAESP